MTYETEEATMRAKCRACLIFKQMVNIVTAVFLGVNTHSAVLQVTNPHINYDADIRLYSLSLIFLFFWAHFEENVLTFCGSLVISQYGL
jgi:hypothetical protein